MLKRFLLSSTLLLLSASAVWAVFGIGDVVIDPTNLVQTTMSAINTARGVAQQARQISNEITQIPLQLSGELASVLHDYQKLLGQTEGMSFNLHNVRGQYEQLFRAVRSGQLQNLPGYTAQLTDQLRQASKTAFISQAITDQLDKQRTALRRAISASESAQGNLAVQQAGNQISGVLAAQQAALLELMTPISRAETSLLATQTALDEAARENAAHAMQDWGKCASCNEGLRELPKFR